VGLSLSVPLLLITGLVLFLLGGLNRKSFTLQGALQKRRQTLRTRLALAPLIGMLVSSFLRFSGLVKGDLTWIVLLVSPWIATAVLGRFFLLRGLQLQAVYLDDQLFEVRGFSKAFLKQLKRHSDEH
jgi:asparagine N-glycosylation enzyme membrane subunit Stt3